MESQHRFITGNHDSPTIAKSHLNVAGIFGYIPDDGGIFFYRAPSPPSQQSLRIQLTGTKMRA